MSSRIDAAVPEAQGGNEERHEIKFAAYSVEYERVRHWLRMHPAGFVSPYPDRRVNNVYFDNYDYRAYAENLAGVSERSKLRYRWYGDSPGPDSGSLEVKQKRNHFGWKLRFPVANPPWQAQRTWSEVRSALREQLPENGRLWLDQNPLPIMLNRYERKYFVSGDSRIRATIDTRQRVFDQRYGALPNFSRQAVMQDTLVVEFKFARADRQDVVAMLRGFPLRIGRHSKFMNAVRAIGFV
ncbi:MAG: polyphosphate polymerase domain-containing protein [Gammaproteobacteria bacterium]|nr:polyphosphate polymerase domain-containing protein [Gammaproteobacteria bacterium]NND53901.1 polyphosphate polymerase domain-containing protein [Gammaproteobacteria bacterium]